jgi:hypothetical protein
VKDGVHYPVGNAVPIRTENLPSAHLLGSDRILNLGILNPLGRIDRLGSLKSCLSVGIRQSLILEGALIEVRQETIITTKRTNSIHTYIPPFVFCNCYFFLPGVDRQWPLTTELPLL